MKRNFENGSIQIVSYSSITINFTRFPCHIAAFLKLFCHFTVLKTYFLDLIFVQNTQYSFHLFIRSFHFTAIGLNQLVV